jgi:hypothetical protein
MAQGNNISSVNSFEGGLVTDLHNLTSPSNTVVDSLNMELVTIGNDQYIYQNIRANKKIAVDFPMYTENGVEYQFIPLGLKVHNNIAYILAGAFKKDGTFLTGTIGTFPSPNWAYLNDSSKGSSRLYDVFSPLYNYKKDGESSHTGPFISKKFEFERNRHIDIEIQGDFDNSVNILFTDNKNNLSIINSRFKRLESNDVVKLADRLGLNDSNTYSKSDWDRITLIQNTNFPVTVVDDEDKPGFTVAEGGYLRGGGYRYYFKYSTQEGNTTEILYESPLIPIANGNLGLNKSQLSDKLVRFTLKNLDTSYTGIKVYFAHFDGEDQAEMELFTIDYIYTYDNESTTVIVHSGLEEVSPVDISEINVGFTPIDTVRSAVIINDRLALAGASSTISESDLDILSSAAKDVTLWEKTIPLEDSYANANASANKLGYWKGEVYEFATVFMLKNKGLSPAFPVTGMDNFLGLQSDFLNNSYPEYDSLLDSDGFAHGYLINNKGIFRTSNQGKIYTPTVDGKGVRHVTYIEANVSSFKNNLALDSIAAGFFIVRRKRIKNVLLQGMAVPTLKVPAKYPSLYDGVLEKQAGLSASRRYLLKHFGNPEDANEGDNATIGFNGPYSAITVGDKASFNADFDTVFTPQPTQILNVLTAEKSWVVSGALGQNISYPFPGWSPIASDPIGETIDREGNLTGKMHIAFYSCELEMNLKNVKGYLNGIDPEIEIQNAAKRCSPLGYTYTGFSYKSTANIIVYLGEEVSMNKAPWTTIPSKAVKATILDSGRAVYSNGGFSSKIDRSFGLISENTLSTDTDDLDNNSLNSVVSISYGLPYRVYDSRYSQDAEKINRLSSNSLYYPNSNTKKSFFPYSLVSQSYSTYVGIRVEASKAGSLPIFHYSSNIHKSTDNYTNTSEVIVNENNPLNDDLYYVNTGHLANIFRSATGRWQSADIRSIYKFDSNKAYYAVTDRNKITGLNTVDIFRGDGFISKIFKKVTYKNGVPSSKSATASDIKDYGTGLISAKSNSVDSADVFEAEREDLGRNLLDVGQVIEVVTLSNINADIRSTEKFSDEESLLFGQDRDFFPNKENIFGEARPDSSAYNHGYSGEDNPIAYFRIEANSPSFNTEFPNRVLLSERNKTQSFFNSFRDLKGFNFRDYGVELGPIIKLASIKNILLTIHPTGVLAIGVDDKTLVAEGSDVYVNTAQSLSPTSKTISEIYGSVHPESVVKTDLSIAGVDYNASAVWIFQGDKLSIISEFAIRTLLDKYKNNIDTGSFEGGVEGVSYNSRVYSTFNYSKHTLYISYVAEDVTTKKQYHVGTVSYSTVLSKWMSRISEGNKFSMFIGANTYTSGFKALKNGVEVSDYTIWKEDSLLNTNGNNVRARLRGINYNYEFEIIINKEPALEKILNNIRLITNKSIPIKVVYTTSGDENDAARNIWEKRDSTDLEEENGLFTSSFGNKKIEQKIITRNKSARNHLRLGILDENAYYKNSGLYIEVGKVSALSRKSIGTKRIRDKSIKVRFIYSGNDETFLQGIISMLSISHS